MAEEQEDYAVAAAREWFAGTQRYIDSIEDDPNHPITRASAQAYLDDAVQRLAAIIRKHVESAVLECGCKMATPDCKAH
jgi:hypothetical protein